MATYKRRLRHIFRDDWRTLIVAMDHGSQGPLRGLERPGAVLEEVVKNGADAVLTSLGVATTYIHHTESCGLIVRIDGGSGFDTDAVTVWQRYPVADAVAIGADAVACMGLVGWPCEAENLRYMTQLVCECQRTGTPLMVEVMPFHRLPSRLELAAEIARGVRMAAELGADFVKTTYTGDSESFRKVVESTFIPVVILGGPKVDSELELLSQVSEALRAGAAGIAFGRNIWQHRCPGRLVRALRSVIHEGARPELALKLLED